jgi:hypothetical protein
MAPERLPGAPTDVNDTGLPVEHDVNAGPDVDAATAALEASDAPEPGTRIRVVRGTEDGWFTATVDGATDTPYGYTMMVTVTASTAAKIEVGRQYAVGADADWRVLEDDDTPDAE